jgi:hypothetical protein
LPVQGTYDAVAILSVHLDQHDKARAAFDQCGDVAVFGTALKIAFPVARDGTILDLGRSVPDRYGINDLPASGLPLLRFDPDA